MKNTLQSISTTSAGMQRKLQSVASQFATKNPLHKQLSALASEAGQCSKAATTIARGGKTTTRKKAETTRKGRSTKTTSKGAAATVRSRRARQQPAQQPASA